MEFTSLSAADFAGLERELVGFIFERSWGTTWRGENIPKDLFRSVVAHARKISDSFTVARRDFKGGYLRTKEGRSAYLLYFHLANMVRTKAALDELRKRNLWPSGRLRILDIGCASAPSLWAAALSAKETGSEIEYLVGTDQEIGSLRDAEALWERFRKKTGGSFPNLKGVRADFFDPRTPDTLRRLGRFDLIFCSNVLNELDPLPEARRKMLFQLIVSEMLTEQGLLLLWNRHFKRPPGV